MSGAATALRPLILICDDERPLRELVKAALGDGFRFGEAGDAVELERQLELDVPSLIVLDVMLPGKSGLELLAELRADTRTALVPVVVVSAWHGEYEAAATDAGANVFVGKPFDPDELAAIVGSLLAA